MPSAQTNVAFVKNTVSRQWLRTIALQLTLADFVARGNVIDLEAPQGSELVAGAVNVTDNSDDTGTDTLSVGDPGSAARYHAAIDLKSAARTELTPTGFVTDGSPAAFRLTRAPQNGNATGLVVNVWLQYVTYGVEDATDGVA